MISRTTKIRAAEGRAVARRAASVAGRRLRSGGTALFLAAALLMAGCKSDEVPVTPTPQSSAPRIEGRVYDGETGQGIAGALVSTVPPSQSVTADANGHFTIGNIAPGQYTVIATKAKVGSGSAQVTLPASGAVTADIVFLAVGAGNHPPDVPSRPRPDSAGSVQGGKVTLSWTSKDSDGDPVLYDVYFGTANPPATRVASGIAEPTFATPALQAGTYYWMVVARDNHGGITVGPIWSFTIAPESAKLYSAYFDGSDDYATVTDDLDLRLSGGDYTLEAWVKPDLVDASWRWVLSKSGGNDDTDYILALDKSNSFLFQTRYPSVYLYSYLKPKIGEWYHLAAVHDQTQGKLLFYINGMLDRSVEMSSAAHTNDRSIFIGAREYLTSGNPFAFFKGEIDEIRIWNVARSSNDINASMGHRLTGSETGLVAYWPFDDGNGTTAEDVTGNGHTAELHNGATWKISTAPVQ